tara:strand:- start:451 stop:1674 length:1224 start_codon:yes stop_codon:yes gene_type:complete
VTAPTPKVEVGFDLSSNPIAPLFKLDDSTQGRLDNTEYRLGGTIFYDVTSYVRNISLSRGRTQAFATFPVAEAQVDFNNHDRTFDPLYVSSPYFGQIVPRREIRVYFNNIIVFTGFIEDWDLGYTPDGDSLASAKAFDASYVLNTQVLDGFTPTEQLAGARINAVLDKPEIAWPSALRDIDAGIVNMGTQAVEDDTNVFSYIQNIAQSDPGHVFMTKDGKLGFRDRLKAPTSSSLVSFGAGGIAFESVQVIYGSELLYNSIHLSRKGGGVALAVDNASVNAYGRRDLKIENMHLANDADLVDIAVGYASLYSQPEYRFEGIQLSLAKLSTSEQNEIFGLEIGDICEVTFTPNNIGDPISKYVEVIRIARTVDTEFNTVDLGFQETRYAPIVLDDTVFGKLDVGTLSW